MAAAKTNPELARVTAAASWLCLRLFNCTTKGGACCLYTPGLHSCRQQSLHILNTMHSERAETKLHASGLIASPTTRLSTNMSW